jgi:hypothetical protein
VNRTGVFLVHSGVARLPVVSKVDMGNAVYGTPVPANGVLDTLRRSELCAMAGRAGGTSAPVAKERWR